jgi:hypothetical protein
VFGSISDFAVGPRCSDQQIALSTFEPSFNNLNALLDKNRWDSSFFVHFMHLAQTWVEHMVC